MNKGLLAINGVLGVAVIVLFYLHFNGKQSNKVKSIADTVTPNEEPSVMSDEELDSLAKFLILDSNITAKNIKIAYVNSDSLDKNLLMLVDVKDEIKAKDDEVKRKLQAEQQRLEASFKSKMADFESRRNSLGLKINTMTDAQIKEEEAALTKLGQELSGFNQQANIKLMEMENLEGKTLVEFQSKKMMEYYRKVQEYCKTIANRLGFDFVLSYQDGGQILHANEAFDISKYVVESINKEYKAKTAK